MAQLGIITNLAILRSTGRTSSISGNHLSGASSWLSYSKLIPYGGSVTTASTFPSIGKTSRQSALKTLAVPITSSCIRIPIVMDFPGAPDGQGRLMAQGGYWLTDLQVPKTTPRTNFSPAWVKLPLQGIDGCTNDHPGMLGHFRLSNSPLATQSFGLAKRYSLHLFGTRACCFPAEQATSNMPDQGSGGRLRGTKSGGEGCLKRL